MGKSGKRTDDDTLSMGKSGKRTDDEVPRKRKKKGFLSQPCGRMTKMSDLSPELIGGEIFPKIPITSLKAVRSTCKLWNLLSREWLLGARQQFLGFMTLDSRVCFLRHDGDLVDLSVTQVDILDQVKISKVFHYDGLLLCVSKHLLIVWNPYLGQKRWIGPRKKFHRLDRYAIGYDNKRYNHKILRFLDEDDPSHESGYEIYDLSSNSWRVLDVTPNWDIEAYHRCVSLKGNAYFFAQEKAEADEYCFRTEIEDFLLCFDFTTERFGPRLRLPFHSYSEETVSLSCIRQEKLAVLYQRVQSCEIMEIWVTTKIESDAVSWSMFLKVDMRPLTGFQFDYLAGSFFIDEKMKVAVVFDVDEDEPNKTSSSCYHTAYVVGQDGYFKSMRLREARKVGTYRAPLLCTSSYHPSLVQLTQPGQRKERDY